MRTTTIFLTAALVLASCLGVSCQKEMSETAEGTPVTVIGTINDDGATKVSLSEGTNAIKTAWEVGDNIIGWDESGNSLELKIADNGKISNGTAVFTIVSGTLPTAEGAKIKMIYAPGKTANDLLGQDGLTYSLASQSGKVPALMTATGTLSGGQIALSFTKVLALVAVKNLTLPVSTTVTNLKLSGSNIKSSVTISKADLSLTSLGSGPITRICSFTTAANVTTSGVMEYFAVAPNSTSAQVTVSTVDPTGYEIIKTNASFAAGNCYMFNNSPVTKQKFTVTVQSGITNGTITTNPTGSVAWDTQVNVTATPYEGYELATLTYNDGAGHDIKSSKSFHMPKKDVTVSGSFQKKDYTITASVATGGTYTVKKSGDDVTKAQMGDLITVTPAASTGYSGGTVTVKTTSGNNNVTVTNNTFTMPAADVTITVTFTPVLYSITGSVTPNSSGSVTFKKSGSSTGITQAYYNEEIIVNATPNTNYELVSIQWKEDGGSNADITSTKKFTMPAKNVTVTVTFKPDALTITKMPVPDNLANIGASFKVTKGGTEVSEATPGDVLKVEVTCPNGYKAKITVYKTGTESTTVTVGTDGSFKMPAYAVSVDVAFTLDESGSGTELTPGGLI